MRYPTFFVLILNWNGKKDTLECLASLVKISSPRFQTLLIDNASTDDSVAAIRKQYPNIPILENRENLGYAAGNNAGIEWALSKGAEWILLLNNDTVVDPHCFEGFLEATRKEPEGKIFGAKIYSYHEPRVIDALGSGWDSSLCEMRHLKQGLQEDDHSYETMERVDAVSGAALLMHRSVPETIGLLEPRFFLFWEETDFCMRAARKGFPIWTAPQAKVWHKVGASFIGGKPHTHYFFWRSYLLFLERNELFAKRRHTHRTIVLPKILKAARHYLLHSLRSLWTQKELNRQKAARNKAALLGVWHYATGRFGDCPTSLKKSRS
ncbi:MAG: glycosyltransferase family 2 protein [Verrucomicrobiota bacterium]|nr:glycosyltransferase family 2 protein [Verrucomicrobiota bacterium]